MTQTMTPADFLAMLVGDGHALVRTQDEQSGKVETRVFQPKQYNPEQVAKELRKVSLEGRSVWACVSSVDPSTRSPLATRVVWADLDFKNYRGGEKQARELIKALPIEPSLTVKSGHGLHVYYLLDQAYPPGHVKTLAKALQWRLGADAAHAAEKLMRIPGTVNPKHLSQKGQKEGYTEPQECVVEVFTAKTYEPREIPRDFALERLPHGLVKDIVQGPEHIGEDRSAFDFKLGVRMAEHGLSDDEIWGIFQNYPCSGKAAGEGSNRPNYIRRTIQQARLRKMFDHDASGGQKSDKEPAQWVIKSFSQLKESARADFVVEDFLPVGGVGLIAGPPKTHKSWTALQLAHAVATGQSWLDFKVNAPRKVLYVQAELPEWMVCQRLEQLFKADIADVDNLAYITIPSANLMTDADMDGLVQAASNFGAELVIIDPIANFWQGDENNSSSVNVLFDQLSKFKTVNCAVLLIHHARKTQAGEKITAQHMRGSNVFFARPDAVMTLTPTEYGFTWAHRVLRAAAPRDDLKLYVAEHGGFVLEGEPVSPVTPKMAQMIQELQQRALVKKEAPLAPQPQTSVLRESEEALYGVRSSTDPPGRNPAQEFFEPDPGASLPMHGVRAFAAPGLSSPSAIRAR